MYNSQEVANRIKSIAKKKNIVLKTMFKECSLGTNMLANMNTSMPKADNLAKIADYLDCSVDYLLGRSENTKYSQLNENGKAKVNEYINDLLNNPNYTKDKEIISDSILQEVSHALKKDAHTK